MLEKKAGQSLLNRLHGIIILEVNYNWVLQLIWGRHHFQNAAKTNSLMSAQQARPGFQSITAALNKVLAYDLICLTKRNGGSFDNNAEGCYDVIAPPHTMLCCQQMRLPKSAAKMLSKIFSKTMFKLKTGHDISARHHMSNTVDRILGTCQESGASPCIWTLVLDTILWLVATKYTCFQVTSPTGIDINRVDDAFVDDTSIF